MRVLITGAAGFAGSHLVEHCLAAGDEVWGTCLTGQPADNLVHVLDQTTIRVGDVCDPDFIPSILSETRFDVLYHLAGLSFVPDAERDPLRAYRVNLIGGLNVLAAVLRLQPRIRVVLISSAEVYGTARPEQMPLTEAQPFAPVTVTAACKAALEMAAYPYAQTHGLHIVVARPFNHTGPRQSADFVCSSLAEQVARIEAGAAPALQVGDVSVRRDFTDVRDVVRAYRLLAIHGLKGEAYNVASGRAASVQEVIDLLTGMARVKVEVREEATRLRRAQVMVAYGSFEKLQRRCDWKPDIPLERTLRDLLNWHRDVIQLARRRG